MSQFDDIRSRLTNEEPLSPVAVGDVASIRSAYSGIPEDYLEFLGTLGFGNLRNLFLYSGPSPGSELYKNDALKDIILIGDDGQGYCFGFDSKAAYQLVEVDPRGSVEPIEARSFAELIRARLD